MAAEVGRPGSITGAAVSVAADNLKLASSLSADGDIEGLDIDVDAGDELCLRSSAIAMDGDSSSAGVTRRHGSGSSQSSEAATTRAASEGPSSGGPTAGPLQHYTFDDLLAAEQAGYERGRVARVELEAEQRAYALVHERAVEMLGLARREAARKGPAWLALLNDSAAQPWGEEWSR